MTDIHTLSGIRNQNPSKGLSVDARLRTRRPLVSAIINLDSFKQTRSQSCEKRLVALPCPSVRPFVRPSAEKNSTLEALSWNFVLVRFVTKSRKQFRFSQNRIRISDTAHDNVSKFYVFGMKTGLKNRKLILEFYWQHTVYLKCWQGLM
jgi:hypothetical protein